MLTDIRASDYLIWGVAGLLYIWDSARLLSARQLLLVEASRGRLSAIFADSPYTISGRILAFCPLFRPYRGAFVAPWGQRWDEPNVLDVTLGAIAKLRSALLPVRVLATWSFVVLFIVGPVLTLKIGPNAAVVYTAICVYWTVLMALLLVWWQRAELGLTPSQATWLSLDLVICPAFLPNLVRKVTAKLPIGIDGAQLLFATASSDVKELFVTRLASRTEGLPDEAMANECGAVDLEAYVANVRAAR